MIRLASPFPTWHSRCPLGSATLAPAQIAGILDGDGSFALDVSRGSDGRVRARPRVGLFMRDDDPTPFAVWQTIRTRRGRAIGRISWTPPYRRNAWTVESIDEVVALTDWLADTPPISPRGYRQFASLRETALILGQAARGSRRGRVVVPNGDRARIAELQAGMPRREPAYAPLPAAPTMLDSTEEAFGWGLSGLIAAEGYFGVKSERGRYAPVFALSQRIDNRELLVGICERVRIGTVEETPATLRSCPQSWWIVRRQDDCLALVAHLRRYPLPPSSPKARQLPLWAEALGIHTTRSRLRRVADKARLAELHALVKEAKGYAGPRLLCACPAPEPDAPLPPDAPPAVSPSVGPGENDASAARNTAWISGSIR